jgi:hypothetical protein
MKIRVRGEVVNTNGAHLVLLMQGMVDGVCTGYLLTSQPIPLSEEYQDVTLHCTDDANQWTALGARHDRSTSYGARDFKTLLASVDCNFIFVLFPLDVRPVYGACFSTEIQIRGCHWLPRLLPRSSCMCVPNGMSLGCPLFLLVHTVTFVQTLKGCVVPTTCRTETAARRTRPCCGIHPSRAISSDRVRCSSLSSTPPPPLSNQPAEQPRRTGCGCSLSTAIRTR